MWRKIHSNRDPRDTLYHGIRQEFSTYFTIARAAFQRLADTYPKFFFACMIFLLAISIVLSFTVFRHPEKTKTNAVKKIDPVTDGFDEIMLATGNIRETLKLKRLVDSLSSKKHLTKSDSAFLDSALDRLSTIHQTLK